MKARRTTVRTAAGLLAAVLATASAPALALPAAAPAAVAVDMAVTPRGVPVVRPAHPVPGDVVTTSGRAALPGHRTVTLQVRREGRWVGVRTTRTGVRGRYAFRRPVRVTERQRVLAPAVTTRVRRPDGRVVVRRVARWASPPVVVRPRRLTSRLSLSVPNFVEPGVDPRLRVAPSPTVRGRLLRVEVLEDGRWQLRASVREDGSPDVALPFLDLGSGEHRVRVVAPVTARHTSAVDSRTLRVLDRVAPDPEAHGALPRLEVTTPDGAEIRSRTDYTRVTMTLDASGTTGADGAPLASSSMSARMRVRGNSTSWVQTKLPYKVKLDERVEVLGMPASKDWVLLANFYDRSLMRNTAAFHAARRVGVPWAPRLHDVDLYVNGTYRGVYQLGEGVEVEPARVDLGAAELPEEPGAGGWLLEADFWEDTDPRFTTASGIQFYVKEAGADSEPFLAALAREVQDLEDTLYGPDFGDPVRGYRALVDVESFVDWYLLQELTKNVDANFNTSVYVQRAVGGRVAMGPPWDFDHSAGLSRSFGLVDPEGWFVHAGPLEDGVERAPSQVDDGPHWIQRMLEDPWFRSRVQARWQEVSPRLKGLPAVLVEHADRLTASAERNFAPAPDGAGMPLGPTMLDSDAFVLDRATWREHADALVQWYRERIAWLDRAMPTLGGGAPQQ